MIKKLNKKIFDEKYLPEIQKELNYKSIMQAPRLSKVIINVGAGDAAANPKLVDSIVDELTAISGQKPVQIKARKSIASFKLRENSVIGIKVTLRGDKMYNFVFKLINVAIPRIRDFQGVSARAFDGNGNYSLGIKEQIIFPEIEFDKVVKVRGMDITFVTTSNNDNDAYVLLKTLGMPFAKKAN